jgi:hypothetical protein
MLMSSFLKCCVRNDVCFVVGHSVLPEDGLCRPEHVGDSAVT